MNLEVKCNSLFKNHSKLQQAVVKFAHSPIAGTHSINRLFEHGFFLYIHSGNQPAILVRIACYSKVAILVTIVLYQRDRFLSNTLIANHKLLFYRILKKLRFSSIDNANANQSDVFLLAKKLQKRKPLLFITLRQLTTHRILYHIIQTTFFEQFFLNVKFQT